MSQQADVTLNTIVYSKAGVNGGVASWINRAAGVIAGFTVLKQFFKSPVSGTQTKIDFNLSVPVVATADSGCHCAGDLLRTNSVTVSVWVAATSTTDERTDLYLRLKDLVATPMFQAAVKDLDPVVG